MSFECSARKNQFPSTLSKNHFGNCLIATRDLPAGTLVQKFLTEPTDQAFNGDLNAPLDERHVMLLEKDAQGKLLYGKVTSQARYINHSCDPNCEVNGDKEIYTIKPVKQNEELTIAYDAGSGQWEPGWNFQCLCLAKNCRGMIDSYKSSQK